jgi:hypothetical protein
VGHLEFNEFLVLNLNRLLTHLQLRLQLLDKVGFAIDLLKALANARLHFLISFHSQGRACLAKHVAITAWRALLLVIARNVLLLRDNLQLLMCITELFIIVLLQLSDFVVMILLYLLQFCFKSLHTFALDVAVLT